ncbi:hypothetical protein EVJ22_04925 [Exiguobacterium sp. SH0S7]|nr:hypothetical protein EVJ22_04925 [Exiguobacterium sp. SH0S7]
MMPDLPNMPPSPYAALYDLLIPADDELRLIHDLVSFDFVTDLLADTYCHDNGRMAIRKARTGTKNIGKNQKETQYFDIKLCKQCPLREGCYKDGAKSRTHRA